MLKNEVTAKVIATQNTPKLYDARKIDSFYLLKQELISGKPITTWRDWHKVYKRIIPSIINNRNRISKIEGKMYTEEIKNQLVQALEGNRWFSQYEQKINQLSTVLLEKYIDKKCFQYKIFVHGDLTPRNVLKNKGKFFMIDFANGGYHNSCYDLMIQVIYDRESGLWKEFNKRSTAKNKDINKFNMYESIHIKEISKSYDIEMKKDDINAGIVLSILEMIIKNINRHKTEEAIEDGIEIIEHMIYIMNKIVNS